MGSFWSWLTGYGSSWDIVRQSKERGRSARTHTHAQDDDRALGDGREILRLEGRNLDRNHGMLFGVLNRIADYSMPNVSLRFDTGDVNYDRAAEDFLQDWFQTCDIRGLDTFPELCWKAVRMVNLDGDEGFILRADGRIQAVESELIVTPAKVEDGVNIINGVELNELERPIAFHVASRDPKSGLPDNTKTTRIEASDFVFYRTTYRFDTVRGLPAAGCILPDVIDQRELHRAYVRKTKSDATRAFSVHTEDGHMPDNLKDRTDSSTEEFPDGRPPTWSDSGLKAFFLKNTEEVNNISPSTPSGNIVEYEASLVRMMGSALGIPSEFWTLDLTGLSWSTANATVKLAGDAFRSIHARAVRQFILPIISWRLTMAIRDGDIPMAPVVQRPNGLPRSLYNKVRVSVPEYLWADEEQHLKSAKLGWQLGSKSLDSLASETGETREEMLARKKGDMIEAIKIAQAITKETKVQVSWDQVINAGTPGVTSLAEIEVRESAKQQDKSK